MRKPGQADTLVKIASLGGGGLGVAKSWQDSYTENQKVEKSLKNLKDSEPSWEKWKADNERRKKALNKAVAKKKLEKKDK